MPPLSPAWAPTTRQLTTPDGRRQGGRSIFRWTTNAATELLGCGRSTSAAWRPDTITARTICFNVSVSYAPSPRGSLAKLYINGDYWGLYSLAQQEDGDLVKEWFPSNDGDRWRAPNVGGGQGGAGQGGGFSSAASALSWLGTNVSSYTRNYELKKSADSTNAWIRLVHAIDVLNNTATADLRDAVEDVLAVDSWLWFLAVENIFTDDDSYWNKGADYGFYFEPESGRIHPIEHDGNEAFITADVSLSPVAGASGSNRPVLSKLLAIPELRQRYLAHMRTVLAESFHPDLLTPLIDRLSAQSVDALAADTRKGFTMTTYTNELRTLKSFVTNRHNFLTRHAELTPLPPVLAAVSEPEPPAAGAPATITATVQGSNGEGIASVWLWHRAGSAGKYSRTQMLDDGAHGDGAAGDGVFGGQTAPHLAGVKVRYYVEARSANTAGAAAFHPAQAEVAPLSYRVVAPKSGEPPVVINEFMASNTDTIRDPQGDYDDWIELRNVSDASVDLSGWFLSDNPENPRKWEFPAGTVLAVGGYLLVWADEDGGDSPGLHANFKLSAAGEQILLVDSDAHLNVLRDSVTYGPVGADVALGRTQAAPSEFLPVPPTPGAPNP
ncbi:MAG: CotH kinase family protein [Verrucomicrobiae bacterium]|nr:CotH kinase family protein [Verrucomicrobiae bacterium]